MFLFFDNHLYYQLLLFVPSKTLIFDIAIIHTLQIQSKNVPDPEMRKYQKTTGILFTIDDPRLPNSPPKITFSTLYLHTRLYTSISELLKNICFLLQIYLTVLQQSCVKMTKNQQRGLRSIKTIKNHSKSKTSILAYTKSKFTF